MAKHMIYAGLWLSLVIRTTTGALERYPTDLNATVGQEVTLPCKTNLDLTVFWYFDGHEVFYGGRVAMSFQTMFRIASDEKGEYNLVIPSADESYNGQYICGDDEGQGEKRSAQLYVTVSSAVTLPQESESTYSENQRNMIIGIVVGACVLAFICIVVIIVACKKCCCKSSKNGDSTKTGTGSLPTNKKHVAQPSGIKDGNASDEDEYELKGVKAMTKLFENLAKRNAKKDVHNEGRQMKMHDAKNSTGSKVKCAEQNPLLQGPAQDSPNNDSKERPTELPCNDNSVIVGTEEILPDEASFNYSKHISGGTSMLSAKDDSLVIEIEQKAPDAESFNDSKHMAGGSSMFSANDDPLGAGIDENAPETDSFYDSTAKSGENSFCSAKYDSPVLDAAEQNTSNRSQLRHSETTVGGTGVNLSDPGTSAVGTCEKEHNIASDYSTSDSLVDSSQADHSHAATVHKPPIIPEKTAENPHLEEDKTGRKPQIGPKPH